MKRGEIYRSWERPPERGDKAGYYVVVSRNYIADHERIATVICAPIYSEILGIDTEVVVGPLEGLPRECAIRCDYLTLTFKKKLTGFVATLSSAKIAELDGALHYALELNV